MSLAILISKTIRDIKSRKLQSLLIIFAVTASAAGLSGVFSTLENVETGISEGYSVTNQADVIITADPIPFSALSYIKECSSVSDAELRILVNINLLTNSHTEPFVLVGIRDFTDMHLNRVQLLKGHYPMENEILLEDSSARLLNMDIGDTVTLHSMRESVALTISGLGSNPEFVSSSFSGIVVGYTDIATASTITGILGGNALYVSLKDPLSSVDDVLRVLTDHQWYPMSIDRRSAYSGSEIVMGTLMLIFMLSIFMLIVALVFLFILFSSLTYEQKEEIKAIRALGIENLTIVSMYGFHGIILGSVGAVLGALFGYGITRFLYVFFAEDVLNLEHAIHYNIGTSLAIALMVSIISAAFWLWLLLRKRTWAPIESDSFRGQTRWDKLLSKFPLSMRMALRDFRQYKGSFIFMVVVLVLTATAFMCVQSLGNSIQSTLQTTLLDNRMYDVTVSFNSPISEEYQQLTESIRNIAGVRTVEGWFSFEATVNTESVGVFGVPIDTVVYSPRVVEGKWLTPPYTPMECVISEYLSERISASVGDTLVVETPGGEISMTITGIVRDADHDGKGVFIPIETAQKTMHRPGSVTRLFIQTEGQGVDHVVAEVDKVISSLGMSQIIKTKAELADQTRQMTQMLLILLYGIILCVAAMCLAVLLYLFGNLVLFKVNDIVNMRLIGIADRNLAAIFLLESGTIVSVAWAVSCVVGLPFSVLFISLVRQIMLPVDFSFSYSLFSVNLLFVGGVTLTGIVLSLYRMFPRKRDDRGPAQHIAPTE